MHVQLHHPPANASTLSCICPPATACSQVLDVLLLGGLPTGEPVLQRGPFVGSNEAEIRQANLDFQAGLFGHLRPDGTAAPKSHWAE